MAVFYHENGVDAIDIGDLRGQSLVAHVALDGQETLHCQLDHLG